LQGRGDDAASTSTARCAPTRSAKYQRAEPYAWAIERVKRLAGAGHRIVIHTARGTGDRIDWDDLTAASSSAGACRMTSSLFASERRRVRRRTVACTPTTGVRGEALPIPAGPASATVVIPARLGSTRLARKPLLEIAGRTMIAHTHEAAVRAGCGPVLVLTDAEEVADEVRSFRGEVLMTEWPARVRHRAHRLGGRSAVHANRRESPGGRPADRSRRGGGGGRIRRPPACGR